MYQTYIVTHIIEGTISSRVVISAASQVQAVAKAKKAVGFPADPDREERMVFRRVAPGEVEVIPA